MFVRLRKHRQYQYTPRFYKPEEDEREQHKKRIRFRSSSVPKKKSNKLFTMVLSLGFVLYIIYLLTEAAK